MKISAIAIISKNRGLGFENKLLFHIPGELPRFKQITTGHPVIMGRKTFESIGRPLPNRLNIVITRNPGTDISGSLMFVGSLEKALELGKEWEEKRVIASEAKQSHENKEEIAASQAPRNDDVGEVFIIGGGQIFKEALPITDRLYLTIVDKEVPADTFFPAYEKEFTKVIETTEKTDWHYPYRFVMLDRDFFEV